MKSNANFVQRIVECFQADLVFYTRHARFEMENEEFGAIFENEVYEGICSGEIIEDYPQDKPYPSALILGKTAADRSLHIVCAYDEEENLTVVITVYQPNPERWIDYKRRKKS